VLGHREHSHEGYKKHESQCFGFSLILGEFQDLYVSPDSQCDCDSNHSLPLSATNWSACQFAALIGKWRWGVTSCLPQDDCQAAAAAAA